MITAYIVISVILSVAGIVISVVATSEYLEMSASGLNAVHEARIALALWTVAIIGVWLWPVALPIVLIYCLYRLIVAADLFKKEN